MKLVTFNILLLLVIVWHQAETRPYYFSYEDYGQDISDEHYDRDISYEHYADRSPEEISPCGLSSNYYGRYKRHSGDEGTARTQNKRGLTSTEKKKNKKKNQAEKSKYKNNKEKYESTHVYYAGPDEEVTDDDILRHVRKYRSGKEREVINGVPGCLVDVTSVIIFRGDEEPDKSIIKDKVTGEDVNVELFTGEMRVAKGNMEQSRYTGDNMMVYSSVEQYDGEYTAVIGPTINGKRHMYGHPRRV